MSALRIRPFADADEATVIALWYACGLTRPWNDPARDIARKRTVQPEFFLVGVVEGRVVATAMAGYDRHRGSINDLGVDPARRGRGHARALTAGAERRLVARGCPKPNLQVRASNDDALAFYRRLGYVADGAVYLGKRLIEDGPRPATTPTVHARLAATGHAKETPMEMPQNAINWFEIPVDDFDRAKMFYSRVFEYEMPEMTMGPARMGMLPFVQGKDHVGGAIVKVADFLPARNGTLVYLHGGDDLAPVLARVEGAGGRVLLEKTQITPEIGYYATFLDTEGNKVALHSPH